MDKHIETLVQRYPQLESCKDDILKAYQILEEAYSAGRKLLVAGNGGSASDSEHIVGELMKEFKLKRKIYAAQIDRLMQIDAEMGTVLADHLQGSLPAISLVGEPSLTTAFMNDAVPVLIFAQQVNGLGRAGDVFLGISTSDPTLKSKACLKCLYLTKIISDLCRYLEYFSYLYTINQTE